LTRCCRRALGALFCLGGLAHAATYGALVRWLPSPAPVAGYHVWVRPVAGSYGTPLDAGLPAPAADGSLGFTATGLALGTSYAFALSAYAASGAESTRSNEIVVQSPPTTTTTRPPASTSTTTTSSTTSTAPRVLPTTTTTLVAACDPTACPDPGPCLRPVCGPSGACAAVPVADGSPCDAADPCAPGACTAGACAPAAPMSVGALDVGTLVLRTAGRARRLVARGTFVAGAPLDPSASGLVLELYAADGAPLYRAALDGPAFRARRARREFHWAAAPRDVPPGAAGLRRVVVRVEGLSVHVLVVARDRSLVRAAAAPHLAWVVRVGEECARDLDLACAPAPPDAVRCR